MEYKPFVHLHNHSHYSLLDGAITIENLVKYAVSQKFPAIALTDHGNMCGAIEFYKTALKHGIKPIIGIEFYITESRFKKEKRSKEKDDVFHLILLAKDFQGYKNLIKLSTIGYLEGFYYNPRIDKEVLQKYSKGLIALSSCLQGEIPQNILNENYINAQRIAYEYKEIFGNDFYLEIQNHGIPEEEIVIKNILKLSKDLSIPVVATNDTHYLTPDDYEAHDLLLCLQTQKTIHDQDRLRMKTNQFYLRPYEEMTKIFAEIPDAIKNTIQIMEKCNLILEFGNYKLPKFDLPENFTPYQYLEKLALEGLKKRFPQDYESKLDALKKELQIINKMNLSEYFLVVNDIIQFAKNQKIMVGPGRGSAAGSLLCYVLGITDINPLEYGLFFERFLNPGRVTMPDIDVDFEDTRREEIINYIKNKYSSDKVAQIITFGKFKAKAVVKGVARALGISFSESNTITKLIQYDTLNESLENEPLLKELISSKEEYKKLWEISLKLEGVISNFGKHAAGIVISDLPLIEYVPLMYQSKTDSIVTQYDMDSLKEIGLLKIDILGLNTLSIIKNTIEQIKETENIEIDIDKIPLDDKETFKILQEGNALGVFQVESEGMQSLLKRAKPTQFSDISVLIALYRPGPLRAKMDETFIKRKNKIEPTTYIHPSLKPILAETYGVIVYQEQVMKIAQVVGGFSLSEADLIRRAMASKDPEEMEQQREKFINGAIKNKYPKEIAEKIFNDIAQFAEYGFNKSHSVAYAMLTYKTAYLKAHYPHEFMAALLTSELNNLDKLADYIKNAKNLKLKLQAPDINNSEVFFKAKKINSNEKIIVYGLAALKNIGIKAAEIIVNSRKKDGPFSSIENFFQRVEPQILNKKVIESLIKAGAFDCLNYKRKYLLQNYESFLNTKEENKNQLLLIPDNKEYNAKPDTDDEFSFEEKLKLEKEIIGCYFSAHPLDKYEKFVKKLTNINLLHLNKYSNKEKVKVVGIAHKLIIKNTKKNNKKMCQFSLEDKNGSIDVNVMPELFENVKDLLKEDALLLVKGELNYLDEKVYLEASEILSIDKIKDYEQKIVHIKLPHNFITDKETLIKIKEVLLKNKGKSDVLLHFVNNDKKIIMKVAPDFYVNPTEKFVSEIKKILNENCDVLID